MHYVYRVYLTYFCVYIFTLSLYVHLCLVYILLQVMDLYIFVTNSIHVDEFVQCGVTDAKEIISPFIHSNGCCAPSSFGNQDLLASRRASQRSACCRLVDHHDPNVGGPLAEPLAESQSVTWRRWSAIVRLCPQIAGESGNQGYLCMRCLKKTRIAARAHST